MVAIVRPLLHRRWLVSAFGLAGAHSPRVGCGLATTQPWRVGRLAVDSIGRLALLHDAKELVLEGLLRLADTLRARRRC